MGWRERTLTTGHSVALWHNDGLKIIGSCCPIVIEGGGKSTKERQCVLSEVKMKVGKHKNTLKRASEGAICFRLIQVPAKMAENPLTWIGRRPLDVLCGTRIIQVPAKMAENPLTWLSAG